MYLEVMALCDALPSHRLFAILRDIALYGIVSSTLSLALLPPPSSLSVPSIATIPSRIFHVTFPLALCTFRVCFAPMCRRMASLHTTLRSENSPIIPIRKCANFVLHAQSMSLSFDIYFSMICIHSSVCLGALYVVCVCVCVRSIRFLLSPQSCAEQHLSLWSAFCCINP